MTPKLTPERVELLKKTKTLLQIYQSSQKSGANLDAEALLDLRNFLELQLVQLSRFNKYGPLTIKDIKARQDSVLDYFHQQNCMETLEECITDSCYRSNPECFSMKMFNQIQRLKELLQPYLEVAEKKPQRGQSRDKNILVIDDDPLQVRMLKYKLVKDGYIVDGATNGIQALDKLHKKVYDLVICDVMMPGMDGFLFIQKMKEIDKFEKIPLVFLSSASDENSVLKGLELGARDYITKPYSPMVLTMRLKKILAGD